MKSRRLKILAPVALVAAAIAPHTAEAALNKISVRLMAIQTRVNPGDSIRFAIRMSPAHGWHAYWSNPGDSGIPPKATWNLPEGASISDLEHPAPIAKEMAGFVSYIHPGAVSLLATLNVPKNAKPGTVFPITGHLSWLSCSATMCVPEDTDLLYNLQIGSGAETPAADRRFSDFENALPERYPETGEIVAGPAGSLLRIKAPANMSETSARLFPETEGLFDASEAIPIHKDGENLVFGLPAEIDDLPDHFEAILNSGPGSRAYQISAEKALPGPPHPKPDVPEAQTSHLSPRPSDPVTPAPADTSVSKVRKLGEPPAPPSPEPADKPANKHLAASGSQTASMSPWLIALLCIVAVGGALTFLLRIRAVER